MEFCYNKNWYLINTFTKMTFLLALAVYSRSPAAYEALKSFKILQLPSRSTLQSYTGAFLHDPGADSSCLADQVAQYVLFYQKLQKEGKRESKQGYIYKNSMS